MYVCMCCAEDAVRTSSVGEMKYILDEFSTLLVPYKTKYFRFYSKTEQCTSVRFRIFHLDWELLGLLESPSVVRFSAAEVGGV